MILLFWLRNRIFGGVTPTLGSVRDTAVVPINVVTYTADPIAGVTYTVTRLP